VTSGNGETAFHVFEIVINEPPETLGVELSQHCSLSAAMDKASTS
jgi:hypothetical protein